MSNQFDHIEGLQDLGERLRNWKSFGDDFIYDFSAVVYMLEAILDNLRYNTVIGDIEEIGNYLSKEQRDFLIKLAEAASQSKEDED